MKRNANATIFSPNNNRTNVRTKNVFVKKI